MTWKHRNSSQKSLCPVVMCPYLCRSERKGRRAGNFASQDSDICSRDSCVSFAETVFSPCEATHKYCWDYRAWLQIGNFTSQDSHVFCRVFAWTRRLCKSPQYRLVILLEQMAVSAILRETSSKAAQKDLKLLARNISWLQISSLGSKSASPSSASKSEIHAEHTCSIVHVSPFPRRADPKRGSRKKLTLKWLKRDLKVTLIVFWSDSPFSDPPLGHGESLWISTWKNVLDPRALNSREAISRSRQTETPGWEALTSARSTSIGYPRLERIRLKCENCRPVIFLLALLHDKGGSLWLQPWENIRMYFLSQTTDTPFQAAPNVLLPQTCHFCACRARRGNSRSIAKSSPYAGPSAGAEVAHLWKWHVWCLRAFEGRWMFHRASRM